MPVISRAGGIGIGVVAVSNNTESHGPRSATAAGRAGAGNRRQGQAGERRRRGLQENPPSDNPTLPVEIPAYRAAFLKERYCGPNKNHDAHVGLDHRDGSLSSCAFGRSLSVLRPKTSRNFFVVPYSIGLPRTSARPTILTNPL